MHLKYRTRSSVHRKRTRTELTTLFLQRTKRKKGEATVSRRGLEDQKFSMGVRVHVRCCVVEEACCNASSTGNPPVNTGPSPFSDECANSAVEEMNEPTPGSGSLQLQHGEDCLEEPLLLIDGRSSTSRESVVLVNGWRVINNKETLFHYGSLHVANYANEFFSIYVIWAILCLHELEPKCKALSPAWRDSDGSRNMYMLLP
ncbi:hypothetical protein T08_8918 [Trichinella sp. T8]|nr:hypothetical protein T08_8918 [Trichinella sp. T8]